MKNFINRALVAKKHLKLFFALFAMLALGVGNAWGADVTYVFKDAADNPGNANDWLTADIDSYTSWSATKGGSNNPKYYDTGTGLRVYNGGKFTITSSKTLSSITLTFSGTSYTFQSSNTNTTQTVTPNAKSYEWSVGRTCRLQKIEITYAADAGGDEPPTQYTVKWYTAIGTSTDVTLDEGAAITKPATDPTMTGYEFMGWTDQCSVAADGTGFTALTDFGTADSDKEFYAVFAIATTTGGGGSATETTATVSISAYATANSWANSTKYTSVTIDANITATVTGGSNTGKYYTSGTNWRLYQNETPSLTLTAAEGYTIKTAKVTYSVSNTGVLTLNSANVTSGTVSTINAASVSYGVGNTGTATNGQVRVTAIEVVYTSGEGGGSSTTYSNYTTTYSGATVVETLTDAQFAWSAATAEATMGATNTFPTLTNTVPVSVTYESSTPATATIADNGTITLVAPGTTTISAKFAGGEVSGTTYAAKTVTYTLTVLKAPATPTGTVYVKVTDAVTDGEYLIVYEDAASTPSAPVIFDGSLATLDAAGNMKSVTISSNVINGDTEIDAATFTISTMTGGFAVKSKSGKYIGRTSSGNGINTGNSEILNTITITDGVVKIAGSGSGASTSLQYYSVSGQERFRYYGTAQKAIALYKKTNGQQLAGLAYATTKYLTKLGDAFTTPTLTNPNFLTVTYSSSDNNVATVDNTGAVTIKSAGVVTITASFAGDASYLEGSASYTICVTEHAGKEADAYSVADARRVIDVMETAEGVYATGIVSEIVTAYNATYGNITYNISADGLTTSAQLQAFRGKSFNGDNFTSANDVKVGDEVVVFGNLLKYNSTYELDADNKLISLNRNKAAAGLAFETTEYTANVNEAFTAPTLTNPNGLTVTYSTSDATLATVNATTGEVTILNKTGKVTITATFAGNESYLFGTASYNITISDPSLTEATFDATVDKGNTTQGEGSITKSPITFACTDGILGNGSEYRLYKDAAISFTAENGYAITKVVLTSTASGTSKYGPGHLTAEEGTYSYSDETGTWNGEAQTVTLTATAQSRAKLITVYYKTDNRQDAGLAWSAENVSITLGDAFTAPTLSNPNGLTLTCTSDNENLATVTNAGVITLKSGVTGKATITAKFDGNSNYKDAKVSCTITVNPKTETVVILAKYGDQWYAMMAQYVSGKTSHLAALPVTYVGGKLYNVADANKSLIEWERAVVDGKATFKNGSNYLTGKSGKTDLTLATTAYEWTIDGDSYLTGDRTFLYNAENNWFRHFGISNAGNKNYSGMPVVTAPVYATGQAYSRSTTPDKFGTICLPFGSSNYTGATFYEFVGSEAGNVYLGSVTTLVAGVPYIFEASATEVAVYGDGTTAAAAGNSNGLYGTFDNETEVASGDYILLNNKLRPSDGTAKVNANRAYIKMDEVPTGAPQQMPGRRYIGMGVQGENAETGFENIVAPEGETKKVFIDGQIIIIRNGEMFNVQGQRL